MTAGGVLAVFAHPDDESLLAGGTLAGCARAGLEVGLLSLTRGELGEIADPALATRDDLPAVRARELEAAGRLLGVSWTECLEFPDGSLEWAAQDAVRAALAQRIADRAPRAVITFAPEGLYWVRERFFCCEKRCRAFEANQLVQLGYNGEGDALLFVPEWTPGGSPNAVSASFSKFKYSVVRVAPRPSALATNNMFCTAG